MLRSVERTDVYITTGAEDIDKGNGWIFKLSRQTSYAVESGVRGVSFVEGAVVPELIPGTYGHSRIIDESRL